MKNVVGILICLLLFGKNVQAERESRSVNNRNIGEVVL